MDTITIAPIECDMLTLEEIAQRMGIGMTAAYELAGQDRLPVPTIRVGRQFRFSRRAYDALLSRQQEDSTVPESGMWGPPGAAANAA